MSRILIKYPSYINKFKCTGSACIDNCCQNWKIYIDKDTYKKYENIEDKKIKSFLIDNIVINNKSEDNFTYGTIKMKDKCPFLNSQGLCSIQNIYGIQFLSSVCRNYPRIINKINDVYEISLDLSCIEAAGIVLLNNEKVILRERFEENNKYYEKSLQENIDLNNIDIGSNYQYLNEIREKSIRIINREEKKLNDRLYTLGIFIQKSGNIICYEKDYASGLIKSYDETIYIYKKNDNKFYYMMQLSFIKTIFKEIFWNIGDMGKEFKTILFNVEQMYSFNIKNGIINHGEKYFEIYQKFQNKILHKYEYIFNNYISASMFSELFPLQQSDIMYDDYIILLFKMAFIKLCLFKIYMNKGCINEADIVKVIQVTTKELGHRENVFKEILQFLKKNQLDDKNIVEILL